LIIGAGEMCELAARHLTKEAGYTKYLLPIEPLKELRYWPEM